MIDEVGHKKTIMLGQLAYVYSTASFRVVSHVVTREEWLPQLRPLNIAPFAD